MINSFIGSIMNMKCDIYIQQNSQTTSGAISRNWIYNKTINCKVEPMTAGRAGSADAKRFETNNNMEYDEPLHLKMKSPVPLSKRYRITAVRGSDGVVAYKEIDRYNAPDMIFEVVSSHAEIDPLGKINYYEATIKRVPVQENDTNFS